MKQILLRILNCCWPGRRRTRSDASYHGENYENSIEQPTQNISIFESDDQISQIGKNLSETAKEALDSELKKNTNQEEGEQQDQNQKWIIALNNVKRKMFKDRDKLEEKSKIKNHPNFEKDIQLIDDMICFVEEFLNNVISDIPESEIVDLEDYLPPKQSDFIIEEKGILDLCDIDNDGENNTKSEKNSNASPYSWVGYIQQKRSPKKSPLKASQTENSSSNCSEEISHPLRYSRDHLIMLSQNELSVEEPKNFSDLIKKDHILATILQKNQEHMLKWPSYIFLKFKQCQKMVKNLSEATIEALNIELEKNSTQKEHHLPTFSLLQQNLNCWSASLNEMKRKMFKDKDKKSLENNSNFVKDIQLINDMICYVEKFYVMPRYFDKTAITIVFMCQTTEIGKKLSEFAKKQLKIELEFLKISDGGNSQLSIYQWVAALEILRNKISIENNKDIQLIGQMLQVASTSELFQKAHKYDGAIHVSKQ